MEICQEGIDELKIPSWCINKEIGMNFWIQGIFELLIIIFAMILLSRIMRKLKQWWKKRNTPPNMWYNPKNPF